MNKETPTISVIIPVYNEALVLEDFKKTISNILISSGYLHELIFVDDGSEDSTWETLKNISKTSPNIRVLKFTRNFGKEAAIQAGLQISQGKAAIIMDADLQHPPDLLPQLISLWENEGYDVVEGVKTSRQKEPLMYKLGSRFFHKTLRSLTGFDTQRDTDYKLLDKRVTRLYLSFSEKGRFLRALIPFMGFKTGKIPFKPEERKAGQTKYPFLKLLNLVLSAITSFSSIPLHIVTMLGILTLIFSVLLGVQTLYNKLVGNAVEGFTTVILLLLTIGSILMIALGIIGKYIARIFDEVKNRPSYVIDETLNVKDS